MKDKAGNFAIATAILLPIMLASVGISIDLTRLVSDRTQLRSALDAASLGAASALANGSITSTDVQAYAAKLATSQLATTLNATQLAALKTSISAALTTNGSGNSKTYVVKVTGSFDEKLSVFSAFHGLATVAVKGASTSQSQTQSTNALSLYLVIDRSGSMSFVTDSVDSTKRSCQNYTSANWAYYPYLGNSSPCYINKIASLKTAAATLFDTLDKIESNDTTNTILRTGAISFTDSAQTPSAISWGTTNDRTYVNALPAYPTGGTDMTTAMDTAYTALTSSAETSAQAAKGNTSFYKFLVLMTDGENTGASSTWNPTLDATTLATCTKARAAGIKVYTVAYMAPANGKALLLACAGDTSNYYTADTMDSLVSAFSSIGAKVTQQATRMTN